MPDYRKMYFQLAARVADALDLLVKAQQQGENDYVKDEAEIISLFNVSLEDDRDECLKT